MPAPIGPAAPSEKHLPPAVSMLHSLKFCLRSLPSWSSLTDGKDTCVNVRRVNAWRVVSATEIVRNPVNSGCTDLTRVRLPKLPRAVEAFVDAWARIVRADLFLFVPGPPHKERPAGHS